VEEKERLVSEPEQIKLSMKMDNCREKAKALELKDPACQSTTCSFIKGALEAAKEIPGLEEQYEKRSSKISGLICDLDNKIDGLSSSLTTLEAREDEDRKAWGRALEKRDEIKENISRLESAANKIHELGVAEKISADIAKRIQDVDKEALAIKGAFLTREAQKLEDIKALEASIDGLELNLKHDPTKDIEELEQKISLLQDQISDLDKALAMKKADLAKLETDLDAKAESERRLERLKTDRQAILKEQSEWRYLQLACGKDGLRALEIDSVAPVITGEANKLLLSSFGPRSTVKLRTLDDQGRECLDIEVTDEDGDKVLLSNRSGGQQVWVLKALRLGMAVISQEKSGLDFRTMFADEEAGKLDVKEETESALKFIQLYRSLITRNKVDDVVYITHKPECVAMADHVVRFNGAEVTVS